MDGYLIPNDIPDIRGVNLTEDQVMHYSANTRSYEMTGTSLRNLVSIVAKDLEDDPEVTNDVPESFEGFNSGYIREIASKIGWLQDKSFLDKFGKHNYDCEVIEIINHASSDISLGIIDIISNGISKEISSKVLTEIHKRLELSETWHPRGKPIPGGFMCDHSEQLP